MTLLEEAKKIKQKSKKSSKNYIPEDVELVLAHLRGEVTTMQCAKVKSFKTEKKWSAGSLYCYFWGSIKYGIRNNLIEIKTKKEKNNDIT